MYTFEIVVLCWVGTSKGLVLGLVTGVGVSTSVGAGVGLGLDLDLGLGMGVGVGVGEGMVTCESVRGGSVVCLSIGECSALSRSLLILMYLFIVLLPTYQLVEGFCGSWRRYRIVNTEICYSLRLTEVAR